MTKKATVKVELDTKPGKAELRKLTKEGEKSAGKVNDSLGGGFGRAGALGAVAGAGFGLAQRAASRAAGFMPDAISEGMKGFTSWADDKTGGPEARAAKGAREQTKSAYAEIIGRQKEPTVTPGMRNYFNNVKGLREITERGNTAIDQEFGGGKAVAEGIQTLVDTANSGFQGLKDVLGFGGK